MIRRTFDVVEETDASSDQDRDILDANLVEKSAAQTLLRDIRPCDVCGLVACDRLGWGERTLDAVGDEGEGRVSAGPTGRDGAVPTITGTPSGWLPARRWCSRRSAVRPRALPRGSKPNRPDAQDNSAPLLLQAATRSNPALAETLDALDRGHADALIVAKVDRLARSLIDLAGILDRSRRHGWKLVVLDLGLDPSTATGELTAHILGAVAQHERRLISDRTSAALRAKRAQGYRLGRPVQLPDRIRHRIVAERTAGATLTAIADRLSAEGVPTAQGGTRWYPSSVKAVLQSVELDAATA